MGDTGFEFQGQEQDAREKSEALRLNLSRKWFERLEKCKKPCEGVARLWLVSD
jgi:hypothetical protein